MKYKKINIKGFRGIKNAEIDDLSRVNLFLGQNNCGKTSILEAIFLLSGYNNANYVLNIDLSRQLFHNDENDFSFIFFNLDYSNKLTLIGEYFDKDIVTLNILPEDSRGQNRVIAEGNNTPSEYKESFPTSISAETNNSFVNQLEFVATIKGFQKSKVEIRSKLIGTKIGTQFQITAKPDPKNPVLKFPTLLQNSFNGNFAQLPKKLEKVVIEKKKEELIDSLKIIDKKILDITPLSSNMVYVDIGAKSLIPSNLMGDGFLKYLNTILNLNEAKGGIMLIDELDNGLHYKALKSLWRILLKTARRLNIQLFITTHSKEALIYLKDILNEDDYLDFQNEVRCFTISKLSDSELKAYNYDFTAFEYAIDNDVEIRGEV